LKEFEASTTAKQEKVNADLEQLKKIQNQLEHDKMDLAKQQKALEEEKAKPAMHTVMKEMQKEFDLPKDVAHHV